MNISEMNKNINKLLKEVLDLKSRINENEKCDSDLNERLSLLEEVLFKDEFGRSCCEGNCMDCGCNFDCDDCPYEEAVEEEDYYDDPDDYSGEDEILDFIHEEYGLCGDVISDGNGAAILIPLDNEFNLHAFCYDKVKNDKKFLKSLLSK